MTIQSISSQTRTDEPATVPVSTPPEPIDPSIPEPPPNEEILEWIELPQRDTSKDQ